jgi:hypothetical protein
MVYKVQQWYAFEVSDTTMMTIAASLLVNKKNKNLTPPKERSHTPIL